MNQNTTVLIQENYLENMIVYIVERVIWLYDYVMKYTSALRQEKHNESAIHLSF